MRWYLPDEAIDALVAESRPVQRAVDDIAATVETEAKDLTRLHAHNTGKLGAAIHTVRDGVARRIVMAAPDGAPKKLPVWINKGTGIYGPTGQRIRPKNATVLRFQVGNTIVFARSVKGRKGTPIMHDAGVAVAARLRLRWRPSNT